MCMITKNNLKTSDLKEKRKQDQTMYLFYLTYHLKNSKSRTYQSMQK